MIVPFVGAKVGHRQTNYAEKAASPNIEKRLFYVYTTRTRPATKCCDLSRPRRLRCGVDFMYVVCKS